MTAPPTVPQEAPLSSPRIRLHFPPGRPLTLADVRLALFGTLWSRRDDGTVVASVENRSALDDLEWVGIEPDEMAAPANDKRVAEVVDELIDQGRAYRCYCSATELREMSVNPTGFPEPVFYDGRCRKLTAADRAAMEKMGRKPRIRIVMPEELPTLDGIDMPRPKSDFVIVEADGTPNDLFSAVLSPREAGATAMLVDGGRVRELAHWLVIAHVLDWELPDLRVLPPWRAVDTAQANETPTTLTIAALRDAGFVSVALLRAAAEAGWDPGDATDIDEMAARFSIDDLSPDSPIFDYDALKKMNGDLIRKMDRFDKIQVVGEYLERKGYPFMERDPAWQERFVETVTAELDTLADAEAWASILLTSTVDYDREVARTVRNPTTHALIDTFETAMDEVIEGDEADSRTWRRVLSRYRSSATAPGRALSVMRLVLTGQREGPNLTGILTLLGPDGCRGRLEKARRYIA
ncbi:MAG: hypothetical protein D6798_19475 [Deltaproteobacteria bacterium]|nr:MAG: hypothetical protein D6798_19475 [Deltaproteobacteria bacterium]